MAQRLALDQFMWRFYYWPVAMVLLAGGCRPAPAELMPAGMDPLPRETVQRWAEEFVPTVRLEYDVRWTYQTQQGAVRGRAVARFAPPDSLRFDYRGPFGRSGAAVVIGDSLLWLEPEEDVETIFEFAPLFWGAIGIVRDPWPGTPPRGMELPDRRVWLYAAAADTLYYVVTREPPLRLQTEMRRLDKVVGSVETVYDDSTRVPAEATMTFPQSASLFMLRVEGIDSVGTFDPDVWKRP